MKILHWTPQFYGGFGYTDNLITKFEALKGHEVYIFSSTRIEELFLQKKDYSDCLKLDEKLYRDYRIVIKRFDWKRVKFSKYHIIHEKRLFDEIIKLKPDIIVVHNNDSFTSMKIAKLYKKIKIPMIFDNHNLDMASKNKFRWIMWLYFSATITPLILKNEWYVIRTQDDNYINKRYLIPSRLTPYISFGTDTKLFKPDIKTYENFRKSLGVKLNDFLIVYAGKLDEPKGAMFLAKSISKKILLNNKNIVFLIVGSNNTEYGKEVEKVFSESENRIIRFPVQNYLDLPKFYQASDLCIFPKQCSLSFFDVQACGKPVLFENNDINELNSKYNNAKTFIAGDEKDFIEKIQYFGNLSYEEYSLFCNNSLKFVKEHGDYNKIVDDYIDFYKKTIKMCKY